MPCEACNAQFTVFKRKKSCSECRRLYCNHCLVKRKEKILCDRCIVFTTRPLSKVDLLKLKPKDLIFYLQSKHVSTTGCVEKEELVNLVLIHVNSTNGYSSEGSEAAFSNGTDNDDHFSNPFDQIKQTCQNLFTSFTDKITADLNFDIKQTVNGQNQNIFSQPRASSKSSSSLSNLSNSTPTQPMNLSCPQTVPSYQKNGTGRQPSSGPTSPVYSIHSNSSTATSSSGPSGISTNRQCSDVKQRVPHQPAAQPNVPSVHINRIKINKRINEVDMAGSACDCSDDEMINTFHVNYNKRNEATGLVNRMDINMDDVEAGPSGSSSKTASSVNKNKNSSDSSDASSFEELGAVGGLSSDTDNWQIISKTTLGDSRSSVNIDAKSQGNGDISRTPQINLSNTTFQTPHSSNETSQDQVIPNTRPRRLSRRRSDSCIGGGNVNRTNASMLDDTAEHDLEDKSSRKRTKTSCLKCGKSRGNLKRHVVKFRRQLENTNATESEIKDKLDAFLQYLENLNGNSVMSSDSDSHDETQAIASCSAPDVDSVDDYTADENDGIHVYGIDQISEHKPKQFISLSDYEYSTDLDALSVKQLKQLLMLNRVDFKGCCEKTELLERAKRLWKEKNTCPAVDKLPTDDLCKICMDAPIECVILECGHMATCTSCGKVLSECPICRQYIVRVVRFFRA